MMHRTEMASPSTGVVYSGITCENCGTPYDACREVFYSTHTSCCGLCAYSKMHEIRRVDLSDLTDEELIAEMQRRGLKGDI